MGKLIYVGKYNKIYNKLLNISFEDSDIYRDSGLTAHLIKRKHYSAIKYLDYVPDIISDPDYVGKNPNEAESIEFVKCFKKNMHIGIKVDFQKGYMYVATMHEITDAIIERYVNNGRFIPIDKLKVYDYNESEKSDEPEMAPGAPDEGI